MGRARWIGLALAGLVACQGGGEEPDGGERDSGPLLDGGFQDTGPRVPPDPTVGREGGVLVAGAARVEIPRDALSADVALTIRQLDSGAVSLPAWLSAGSAVYEVEPSTALAVPARITLPLASGALASELSGALILTQDASGEWVTAGAGDDEDSLPNDADAERGLVSAQVRHFSRFVVAVVRLGASYSVEAGGRRVSLHTLEGCPSRARPTRPAGARVEKLILHSTVSALRRPTAAEACAEARGDAAAHFVVGRDGYAVQIHDPGLFVAPHAKGREQCGAACPGTRFLNDLTVGVELVNGSDGAAIEQTYSGAQMSVAVQLVQYLLARFELPIPSAPRAINSTVMGACAPANTFGAHGATSVLFHREVDGCRGARRDPAGPFRAEAFFAALREAGDGRSDPGIVFGQAQIQPRSGRAPLSEAPHLVIAAGASGSLPMGGGMVTSGDVIVEGELVVRGASQLLVLGTFHLAGTGRIRIEDGGSLAVTAAGLALIEGEVSLCPSPMGARGRFTLSAHGALLPEPRIDPDARVCPGGLWNLLFSPMIDLAGCGSGLRWDTQNIVVASDGAIDADLGGAQPVLHVRGVLTSSSFFGSVTCRDGARAGTFEAPFSPISGDYVGLYRSFDSSGLLVVSRSQEQRRQITLQGRVVTRDGGTPVSGALVSISPDHTVTATTAADGLFFLVSHTPATEGNTPYRIRVSHPMCTTLSEGPHMWGAVPTAQELTLACP